MHLVFGTGSLEHAATIVCRVAGSEECPDWIQRFFSFEVDRTGGRDYRLRQDT